jgi:hypothetical protein
MRSYTSTKFILSYKHDRIKNKNCCELMKALQILAIFVFIIHTISAEYKTVMKKLDMV